MGRLFIIGDTHFGLDVDKPMDVFGGQWADHASKITENWAKTVSDGDITVVNGDLSWGINRQETRCDLALLNSFAGRKILVKGNHDLWWDTMAKLSRQIQEEHLDSLLPLYNSAYFIPRANILICGTRGWKVPENADYQPSDAKILRREMMRFELSVNYGLALVEKYRKGIGDRAAAGGTGAAGTGAGCAGAGGGGAAGGSDAGAQGILDFGGGAAVRSGAPAEGGEAARAAASNETGAAAEAAAAATDNTAAAENAAAAALPPPEIIAVFHYPPFDYGTRHETDWAELLSRYHVKRCYFGHVHNAGSCKRNDAGEVLPVLQRDGVSYYLTAADYLGFEPMEIAFRR